MSGSDRRPRTGFTLLELLVALSLITLVAGLSIPAYFSRAEVSLENAAVLLAKEIRSAQSRAVYLGEPIELTFDGARHGYRIWRPGGSQLGQEASFSRRYTRDAVFEGVELHDVSFGEDNTLVFDGSGRAVESGQVTLAYRGEVRVLQVESPSGRLRILGSTSGWQDVGFDWTVPLAPEGPAPAESGTPTK